MDRKEFLNQVGAGAAALILPMCLSALTGCQPKYVTPTNVDFVLDVSTGALSANGGYLIHSGVIVARTVTGDFLAVSATCSHQGTDVRFIASSNSFQCPNHGATFGATGNVTSGPAKQSLAQYNTTLTGSSLRVYS